MSIREQPLRLKISVLVPTYRRPQFLQKALGGLRRQTRSADEIVLGMRNDDEETARFLDAGGGEGLPIRRACVAVPGVLASMAAAASQATGDLYCFLDDDAEPLPDWLARIEAHFLAEVRLGALGGKDLLQDHPEMRQSEPVAARVGIFTWYGRILGNHHRGSGASREVHVLKGCNLAVSAHAFHQCGFEMSLRGDGAQAHWELALCLDLARLGYRIVFDPDLRVIHHIAPRPSADQIHRGGFSAGALHDMVWNEHRIVTTRARMARRTMHALWSWIVGSATAPGLLQYLRLRLRRDPDALLKWQTTRRAIAEARERRNSAGKLNA